MIKVSQNTILALLVLLSVIAIGQNAWYWTQLPERVATHFGTTGQPDSWMDRTSATLLLLAVQIGLPWALAGVAQATRVLPASLVNIPNREHWLSGERRETSLAFIQQFIAAVAVTASLFIMAVNHLTFLANTRGESLNLQAFATLLVLYLIGIALMVSAMWKRFRLPKSVAST